MAREAAFGRAEAPELVFTEELGDGGGAVLVDSVGAPGSDDHLTAVGGGAQGLVILGSIGIAGADHFLRVGRAKSEDVGHEKPIETLALGKRPDARECGVKFLLVGRARIEPNPHDQPVAEQRTDAMEEGVAMPPVGREVTVVFQAPIRLMSAPDYSRRHLLTKG